MGMAASQARFLNLTARKTNIEYEGQQINQQRTELSNESANLYNQMLGLQVPTPPQTQDYTKVEYTFMMPGGNDEATISQLVALTGVNAGKYSVVFSYKTTELGFPACSDSEKPIAKKIANNSFSIISPNGRVYTTTEIANESDPIHGDAYKALRAVDGHNTEKIFYVNVGTEANPKYHYFYKSDLPSDSDAAGTEKITTYYYAGDVETYKEDRYTPCTVNRDAQNRVQSFTHTPIGGSATTFAVTTKTVTDEAAYNDAMNEYTYKSYLYEQEMNNINARTSIIQAQDKELELKLKQLDTEHNAVQTEMETVQSICKKNVDDSFKTFA